MKISSYQKTVHEGSLYRYPYHKKVYMDSKGEFLTESLKRTGNKPIHQIICVPIPGDHERFYTVSGWNLLQALRNIGQEEIEITIFDLLNENEIKNLVVDLNKQRIKTGYELMMEFIHWLGYYPQHKGAPGNRYSKIAKELGMSKNKVKDLFMLFNFFEGEGTCVVESIFGRKLSINQANILKKNVSENPEKFDSEVVFQKFCDRRFDFSRLEYSIKHLDPRDELEFELIREYLLKNLTVQEFQQRLIQLGKVMGRIQSHNESKFEVPEVDENYTSQHVHLINGDNRIVEFHNPFGKLIMSLIGSCPYGNIRLNGNDLDSETGHNMTGRQYGVYLAETYARYKDYLDPRGSIYVIIDDFRNEDGSLALSLEHFVVEMEKKGFFLVGRYVWSKANPQPRAYNVKNMVGGFEMVYRFSTNPELCYFNSDLFIELDEAENRINEGCTNTDNKGKTTRGSAYVQSHLKKVRNTLNEQNCMDVIRGNVANPKDFFRQAEEKRHTSTAPLYLTSVLILESTRRGDLVVDIWGGVGNTMESALLLGRDYIGIEKEENYHTQSQRRLQMSESWFSQNIDGEQEVLPAA